MSYECSAPVWRRPAQAMIALIEVAHERLFDELQEHGRMYFEQ
jgi:hypothetical protein